MKATVKLVEPEETIVLEIDAWARMMFERNAVKLGLPAMPTADAAKRFPETFMCICAYYAMKRRGLINGASFEEFELRWDGLENMDTSQPEDIVNPTNPAPLAG